MSQLHPRGAEGPRGRGPRGEGRHPPHTTISPARAHSLPSRWLASNCRTVCGNVSDHCVCCPTPCTFSSVAQLCPTL